MICIWTQAHPIYIVSNLYSTLAMCFKFWVVLNRQTFALDAFLSLKSASVEGVDLARRRCRAVRHCIINHPALLPKEGNPDLGSQSIDTDVFTCIWLPTSLCCREYWGCTSDFHIRHHDHTSMFPDESKLQESHKLEGPHQDVAHVWSTVH